MGDKKKNQQYTGDRHKNFFSDGSLKKLNEPGHICYLYYIETIITKKVLATITIRLHGI